MRINKILAAGVIAIAVTVSACQKFLDVNENPNAPTSVSPKVLLPAAEGSIAYTQGGDISRFTGIMSQYITGYSRQFFGYSRYIMTEEDFNNLWYNLYAGGMEDLHSISAYADAHSGQYTTYQAISNIMMAYTLGMTTDLFGNVPYTEAFKGNDNLKPAYDNQQDIYDNLQMMLSSAIDSLNNEPGDDVELPGADDFVYNGDAASWINFANALRARFYIHLAAMPGSTGAADALAVLSAGGFTGNGDLARFPFSSSAHNPWYQYIEQRDDITYSADEDGVGNFLSNTMSANTDPRYGIYIDVNGDYWGGGYLGPYYSADNSPVFFMTYAEQKFIEAEANLRTGNAAAAQTAFDAGIQASMDQVGVDATSSAAYITAMGTLNANPDTAMSQIMYEKYVANYLSPESWSDWRRTGYPALTPNAGVISQIPRRFIYPTDERLYNPNADNASSNLLTPRLWWDN